MPCLRAVLSWTQVVVVVVVVVVAVVVVVVVVGLETKQSLDSPRYRALLAQDRLSNSYPALVH